MAIGSNHTDSFSVSGIHRTSALLLFCCLLAVLPASASSFEIGFGQRDVTPAREMIAAGVVYMGGYGIWTTRGAASQILDPLTARAICVSVAENSLCLAVVDSLGIPIRVSNLIAARAADATGIDPESILVSATHTHAAPDLLGLWGGSPDDYEEKLVEQVVAAIATAFGNRHAVDLRYARGSAPAYNRRGWGYTDDDLVVLQAVNSDGEISGSIVSFACHPVALPGESLGISSDFVHHLRQLVENETGAPTIFVNGTIGDVTPGARTPDYHAFTRQYGESIARIALDLAANARPVTPSLTLRHTTMKLPVENLTFRIARALGILDDEMEGTLFDMHVTAVISHVAIGGEIEALSVPGEALTRLGLDLKALLSADARLVLGLTGGSLGYFVPGDEWERGRNRDYEESVSLGPQAAAILKESATRLVRASREANMHQSPGAARLQ